jgi:superfamily II DNA or RNA helicase
MSISLSDVLIHIDDALSVEERQGVEDRLRELDGVVSVKMPDDRPHLTLVEYVNGKIDSRALLAAVTGAGVRAELVGL